MLLVNFLGSGSVNLSKVTSLDQTALLGQSVTILGEAVTNPWNRLAAVSSLLFLALFVDSSRILWRRGDQESRRRASRVGGALITFMVLAAGHAYLVNQQVIQSPFGITVCFMGIILAMAHQLGQDIGHAARMTGELRDSQQKLTLAAASAQLALWTWDVLRDEIWITHEGRDMYGVSRQEKLTIKHFLDTLHPHDRGRVKTTLEKTLAGEAEYQEVYRILLGDETIRWISARGTVEFDKGGVPCRMNGVSMDITERRRMEEEMHGQREELVHLSRVTSLGLLSGSLAHEINQPLGIILANAQAAQRMLDQGNPNLAEMREILEDIVSEDLRAGEAIKRLRVLLKRGQFSPVSINPNDVCKDVLKLMQSDLIRREVIVSTDLAENMSEVVGDPDQLQQVLLNLLLNACEAMEENDQESRCVTVTTRALADRVQISIQDQGCGLPEDQTLSIFQPFFTNKVHGMGIGLAISKSIIAAHHGNLWAEPNSSGGATFHLELHFNKPATA